MVSDFGVLGMRKGLPRADAAGGLPVIDVPTEVGSLLAHRDDEVITVNLIRWGVWEAAETRFLQMLLRPGDTFVDVGANIGYFSVLAAHRVGPGGQVIAIEPEPRNVQLLRANLARYGDGVKTTVTPVAAYSRTTQMSLAMRETNRGDHRLSPYADTGFQVRCVRLDEVLPGSVDVIKTDTQGFDHDVIAGLPATIAANPAIVLLIELSLRELEARGIDPDDVLAGYVALGFGIEVLDPLGRPSRLAAADVVGHCAAAARDEISLVLRRAA